ncbi:hypothetical protein GIB67_013361 [Kingdonia uniflora]|uniref:F-box domain-containing protein n=1 Tax=Kingdonia uniflora TaxID=39325 RepID=A0A7J7LR34_9MAGN|nr:hypothetical protein GIB67_013361 [Kingdonia uniflora]
MVDSSMSSILPYSKTLTLADLFYYSEKDRMSKRKTEGKEERKIDMLIDQITEILLKLPTNSLLRFKCVSKSWYSTINGAPFVKLHFSKGARGLIFNFGRALVHVESSCAFDEAKKMDISIKGHASYQEYKVVSSCHGFLCVFMLNKKVEIRTLYVYNPVTKESMELPTLPFSLKSVGWIGFGIHPSTRECKVVVVTYLLYAEMHTLGTDSWRRIHMIESNIMCRVPFHPWISVLPKPLTVLVNGVFHWIVTTTNQTKPITIVSFDLGDEGFKVIPYPDDICLEEKKPSLGVLGGCLSIFNFGSKMGTEVWVMKEYNVKRSWTKVYNIPWVVKKFNPCIFRPLCLWKKDEIIMAYEIDKVICYNPMTGRVRSENIHCNGRSYKLRDYWNFDAINHVESIVSLDMITHAFESLSSVY